jgi:hypothetical protein
MSSLIICKSKISNLFKKPNKNSELTSQLLFGEKFIVQKKIKDYYKGYCAYDNYSGYVRASNFEKAKKKKLYRINKKNIFLYAFPNNKKKTKKSLLFNSKILILSRERDFIKIGRYWIKKESISKLNNSSNNYLKNISFFLNTKYLWGGNSTKGIDCSGLVQELMKSINKKCPRDSKDQLIFFKKKILLSKIKKRDLIFWKGHVAIALDKKKLVHAYGPKKKVTIMSISQTINLLQSKGLNIISIKRPI